MALRQLAQTALRHYSGAKGLSTHAPTVYDRMVQVAVTDLYGNRHIIRGLEGDNLAVVLASCEEDLGGTDVIALAPEGQGLPEAHVTVANEFLDKLPTPTPDDIANLNELAPVHTKNSRLASKIFLSKDLDNLSVALGKVYPWQTL